MRSISIVNLLVVLLMLAMSSPAVAESASLLRMYQGNAIYIDNPKGESFDVTLELWDWNMFENGPREVLVKAYQPDGTAVVREVIEDDGVSGASLIEAGGWDHEMWYYALCYGRGSKPMLAWSAMTDRSRLSNMKSRRFTWTIPGGQTGVYRLLVMGSRDHVADLTLSRPLKFGVAGVPIWRHDQGGAKRQYVYVPRGTYAINLGFAEFDLPVTRSFKVSAPDGTVLWEGSAAGGLAKGNVKFETPGQYDDQLLTVDVSNGAGDYMVHLQLSRSDIDVGRGKSGIPAIFCVDEGTANSLQGGAIYHDDEVYWHPFQVRLHDWLKAQDAEAFVVRNDAGEVIEPTESTRSFGWGSKGLEYKGLPSRGNFVTLNGPHEAPPLSDTLMHSYVAHHNPGVLNVAIRDLLIGLRTITVGDQRAPQGWNGNMAYVFGTYGWHYWRPAWRIVQQSDAPEEVKQAIIDAINTGGDRLAFSRGIERVNGNAFSHIPMALRYAAECTQDPFLRELADVYLERFATGGWGEGAGISPSGDSQEHFAHDYHYGSYILDNYAAVITDLDDARFRKIRDGVASLYAYTYCPDANAWVFGARTGNGIGDRFSKTYKGQPGDDFTVSVNGGDEWFAARRKAYYLLSYHGRLAPSWLNFYFDTKIGYGGGALCQLHIPGKGTVLASSQHGSYGKDMQPAKWRGLHIHSIVGELADGRPLVAADAIHHDATLDGMTVTGSGEVRDRPIRAHRQYVYGDDDVTVTAWLTDTSLREAYWGQGAPSKLAAAWEMIPFVAKHGKATTTVKAINAAGDVIGALTETPMQARGIRIDCGGYGVVIQLEEDHPVHRGASNTVMISLVDQPAKVDAARVSYRMIPFHND